MVQTLWKTSSFADLSIMESRAAEREISSTFRKYVSLAGERLG